MIVIVVESPAKAKKIQTYVGKDYKVLSSYGHIRSLDRSINAININTWNMNFKNDKHKIIKQLKDAAKDNEVIIASDEDREGEAIGWHLAVILKLKNPKRIVFHEITKKAILKALKTPGRIDMDMVNAQLTRQSLDHLIGFRLSPLLWNNIKGPRGLSAGRVQSVVVMLVFDLEKKIKETKISNYYKIEGRFTLDKPLQANISK